MKYNFFFILLASLHLHSLPPEIENAEKVAIFACSYKFDHASSLNVQKHMIFKNNEDDMIYNLLNNKLSECGYFLNNSCKKTTIYRRNYTLTLTKKSQKIKKNNLDKNKNNPIIKMWLINIEDDHNIRNYIYIENIENITITLHNSYYLKYKSCERGVINPDCDYFYKCDNTPFSGEGETCGSLFSPTSATQWAPVWPE